MARFSARPTHSRVARADWVGTGMEESCLAPGVERLAGGQPGGLAAHAPGGLVAAADLLGEQDPQDLGGVPALGAGGGQDLGGGGAQVGQPHPLEHRGQVLGQRAAGPAGSRSWWWSSAARFSVLRRSRPRRRCRAGRSGPRRRRRGRRSEAPVARWCTMASQVALGEAARGGRDAQRRVDGLGADQGGELDRGGHLRPDPHRAGRGGLDQPLLGARPQGEERRPPRRCVALGCGGRGAPSGSCGWSG